MRCIGSIRRSCDTQPHEAKSCISAGTAIAGSKHTLWLYTCGCSVHACTRVLVAGKRGQQICNVCLITHTSDQSHELVSQVLSVQVWSQYMGANVWVKVWDQASQLLQYSLLRVRRLSESPLSLWPVRARYMPSSPGRRERK